MRSNHKILLTLVTIFSLLAAIIYMPAYNQSSSLEGAISGYQNKEYKEDEWIVKWNGVYHENFLDQVYLLDWLPEQNVMRVKLKEETDSQEWLKQWQDNPMIEYIHPNYIYKISQTPNDAHYSEQNYLEQINVNAGWDQVTNTNVTIAILDTGVDLYHPDLKPNLVPGINLIDKEKPPQDDNGHGTNVAGIVGAVGNNIVGVTGVTWKSKIMPIKVLDDKGEGDSFFVGQGIRYAVDNGAKIILLSLGEKVFTPFMHEAVNYAESKGVLVVAASGNEGDELNYPAALPNVLSVGAVDSEDKHMSYSNYGQQLDVVAPGEGIYTTKLGGDYMYNSGTSMAAPQVAGQAALIFQKYPNLSPKEATDLIKFTSDAAEGFGWDDKTGYGRINVGRSLTTPKNVLKDGYETNQIVQSATFFPMEDTFNARLIKGDVDWYKINVPYNGSLKLGISLDQMLEYGIKVEVFDSERIEYGLTVIEELDTFNNMYIEMNTRESNTNSISTEQAEEASSKIYNVRNEQTIVIDVNKGTTYIKISFLPEQVKTGIHDISYVLSNSFKIYSDSYEPNNEPWNAYQINNINKVGTGTFNKDNDQDWYRVRINESGILSATVDVDTIRLDPVILMQSLNGNTQIFDYHSEGRAEFGYLHVTPGYYYISVSDYYNYAALGEYKLNLRFKSSVGDGYEPNDLSTEAVEMEITDKLYNGKITNDKDYDWFTFTLDEPAIIVTDFGAESDTDVTLFNDSLEVIWSENALNWIKNEIMDVGTYYVRLSSPIPNNDYSLQVEQLRLYGNFIDISEQWARDSIVRLNDQGIIEGYDDYTFRPTEEITRGDIALALSRALQLPEESQVSFEDVAIDSKYYSAIAKVYSAGIMNNLDGNNFKPEQAVRRDELIIILTKAFNIPVQYGLLSVYKDVPIDNIAYNEINTFKRNGLLIANEEEQFFRPGKTVTRADFVAILEHLIRYNR